MAGQAERHRLTRFAPKRTAESLDIESLRCLDVVNGKGQMKQNTAHVQRPLTTGLPEPLHQPAVICGVTWAIVKRPSAVITNVPAAPSIRETRSCNTLVAAIEGLLPCARRSQIAFATASRMMPSPWPVIDTAPLRLSA